MSKHVALSLLSWKYLPDYMDRQPLTITRHIARLQRLRPRLEVGSFLASSAVFSAQIEGQPLEPDQYHWWLGMGLEKSRPIQEIDDLIQAYHFAHQADLTEESFLAAHRYASATLLGSSNPHLGAYRDKAVSIQQMSTGKIVYTGAPVELIQSEMSKLFGDISRLNEQALTDGEVFYFAAQIHLCLAGIHPFADGNGRLARLIEKWFLSQRLGGVAWYIQSERNYQKRLAAYYKKINLGPTYQQVDYDHSLPFLLMLPWSLRINTASVTDESTSTVRT